MVEEEIGGEDAMSFIDALAISALETSAADTDSSAVHLDLGDIRRQVEALIRDDAHLAGRMQPDAQPSLSPPESAHALVGELLEHRYRIIRLLGAGSISSLYEAVHVALDRRVAVRILHPGLASEARFRERFAREVTCAAKLRHPNIVPIMDFGVEGPMYFVMELLEGCDLKTLLRQQRRLPWSRTREILLQTVLALDAAHGYGIVHRDLKPSSLFIARGDEGEDEAVKLLDFGIARMTLDAECGERSQELTGSGVVVGSAEYMPPEHARGEPLGRRSDIYSLGIVAYEMLTGRVPFTGGTALQVIARHLDEVPTRPRELEPSIPADVEALLLKMIAKEPSERFASMGELEQAIRHASGSGASLPVSAASVSRASSGYRTGLTSEMPRTRRGPSKPLGALRSLPSKLEPVRRAAAAPIPVEPRGPRTRAEAGATIGGYELVRRIGRGGMAEVWVARKELGRKGSKFVALKMIADHYVGDERFTRMFRAEAELAAVLSHSNIVQVFDEGEDEGRSYLVMEWVDGLNLLKLGGILALLDDEQRRFRVISYIIGQLLYALYYAHSITSHDGNALGIVHRDVSPQNVLVSNHGEVKLTDFGVAFYNFEESSGVHVKGKVRYMAPEQLAGKTRSPLVDLYAVGALLHELLEGRKFRGEFEDGQELFAAVLSGTVPAPVRPIPPELDALRVRLLDPDPTTRVQSAEEAIGLLKRYPGYGDARSELTKLCSSLTGVMRPRMGPRDSSQALSVDQRTTRWASRRASVAPPTRLAEKVLPRLTTSMQTGSMTAVRGPSAKPMDVNPWITGHTEMRRPDVHPPSMMESEVPPDRTATLVMMQTTTGWRPASIVEESAGLEHELAAVARDGTLHRAARSLHDAGIFMEVVTGSDTEQEILPLLVPGEGSSTVRQIPSAVATQTRVVRIVLSRAVVAIMGAALVLLMGLSVSFSWLMFHGREDATTLERGEQPTMPELAEPGATANGTTDTQHPHRKPLSVAGASSSHGAEGHERVQPSALPPSATFLEDSQRGNEGSENGGKKRKLGASPQKTRVTVYASSASQQAQVRIGRDLVLSVVDHEEHRIPTGLKPLSWRKSLHEPWTSAGAWNFRPGRKVIIHVNKRGLSVRLAA
jgi:serine/threonine protein kinase